MQPLRRRQVQQELEEEDIKYLISVYNAFGTKPFLFRELKHSNVDIPVKAMSRLYNRGYAQQDDVPNSSIKIWRLNSAAAKLAIEIEGD